MTVRLSFIITVIISVIFNGCFFSKKTDVSDERVYASVNGTPLTESDFRALVPEEVYDKLTLNHKKEIIKEWVDNELLYQEALKRSIDKDPGISRILENSRRNLLRNELLEQIFVEMKNPSEEEFKSFYKEHEEYFILSKNEYRIRYALFDTEREAKNFWRNIKDGKSFTKLAEEISKVPSFGLRGDLGVVNEEMVEPAIWHEIVKTFNELGLVKISDPFAVMDGWACLIVDKVYEPGSVLPFEAVRDQVFDMYNVEKRQEARDDFLVQLAKKSKIKYESLQ